VVTIGGGGVRGATVMIMVMVVAVDESEGPHQLGC